MSKDMMYLYKKENTRKCGWCGCFYSLFDNRIIVKPKYYGMFLQTKKSKVKNLA